MSKTRLVSSVLVIMLVVVVTAFVGAKGIEDVDKLNIKHSLGEVVVEKNPERVVVFDYGVLDSLDTMGIEVIGLPKSNLPTFLEKFNDEKYQDIGTLFEPNFEKIYELQPDLILISARQAEVYKELNRIAPTVYFEIDGSDYMGSVEKNNRILAEIFNRTDFVEKTLEEINNKIEDLKEKVVDSKKNALIVLANDGMTSVYGQGSRFGIIHDELGFIPVDKGIQVSNHGQSVSFEYILEKNPDYIFVIDRAAVAGGSISARQIFENEIIKETDAYQNGNIVYLNSEIWYVASGGLAGTLAMIEDIVSAL